MIDMKKVCYNYKGNITAVKNISLHIEDGESVAFIGPNGSGKSTFLKIINGIINPDSGKYFFNGEEITEKKLNDNIFSKSFHKKVGFVFQNSESQLFCSSVYDEIAFGLRQMGMSEDAVQKRVMDMLKFMQIEDLKDRQPYHLSGGEKKKIAIACVLSLNPEVLTLDEPMNGLDPKTKKFLKEIIIKLNKSGKTILCSTHDFDYIKGIFKRAVVFSSEHGIIRDGDYDNVLNDTEFLIKNNII